MALFGMATKASETAAAIDDVAQRTNMSAKTLQEFKYAAEESGFSLETIEGAAKKLTITMSKAGEGNKDTIASFKELGINVNDAKGHLKTTDQVFPDVIAKLADMSNITERNALGVKLFGKGFMDMAPMLNDGSKGVTALKDEAHKLGLVMSDESVKAGAAFDDTMVKVKSSMGAVVTNIGVAALPTFQKMLDWFIAHMPQIKEIVSTAFHKIKEVMKVANDFIVAHVVPIFTSLKDWFILNFPKIKGAVMQAYDYIKPSFDRLVQTIKTDLMPIFMGLWNTVKIAMPGVKAVFQLVFPLIVAAVKLAIDIIADIIHDVKGIYNLIKPPLDLVATAFSKVFGGIKKVIDAVTDALKVFNRTPMQDKSAKVTTTYTNKKSGGTGGLGDNSGGNYGFAIGTRYLPRDMIIQAHEGEMIVPKSENPYVNSGNGKILSGSGLTLKIDTFVNNRKEDVEELMEEMAFIMKKKGLV